MFAADKRFGPPSRAALQACLTEGGLVASDVVWAEVVAGFPDPDSAAAALDRVGVRFVALDARAAQGAGTAWRAYRRRSGSRARVIADFLIAAHARRHAERLLTRDRGFYRTCFSDLTLVEPALPEPPAAS